MSFKIKHYFRSPSTLFGMVVGLVIYLSYSIENQAYFNPFLISLSAVTGLLVPFYAKMSNHVEEKIQFKTACVSFGRAGRFMMQYIMNLWVFEILISGQVLPATHLEDLGGLLGIALLTTLASQGFQYVALVLANREWVDKNRNVLAAVAFNVVLTSLATLGIPQLRVLFLILGLAAAAFVFGIGLLSDCRSIFFPKRGIGVFFGTFNPFHRTHAEMIRQAIIDRNLSKVFVHPTVIPKLHLESLAKGEIEIDRYEDGMRVYQKTNLADIQVNYFPTGNRFYEYGTRLFMIQAALEDKQLSEHVEVLNLPETYEKRGFYGVLSFLKKAHPRTPIHGIHGSDLGGMWIRNIYDESGWIYPYPVKRLDAVSATAIRNGARGMASPLVEEIIMHLRSGDREFLFNNKKAINQEGVIKYG